MPPILKPYFDLFGFNVGQNWTLENQLLPPQRAGLRTLRINPLQSLNLLSCVSDIFSSVNTTMLANAPTATLPMLLCHHRHFCFSLEKRKQCTISDNFENCENSAALNVDLMDTELTVSEAKPLFFLCFFSKLFSSDDITKKT